MQSGWVRWIAYLLLAALVVVASCQAMADVVEAPGASSLEAPVASPAEARG